MFVAAMYSAAFFETDPQRVIEEALNRVFFTGMVTLRGPWRSPHAPARSPTAARRARRASSA